MKTIEQVKAILIDSLNLCIGMDALAADTPLLGALPELDSASVVMLIGALEEQFGISIADDEISGKLFETVGSLTDFVDRKLDGRAA